MTHVHHPLYKKINDNCTSSFGYPFKIPKLGAKNLIYVGIMYYVVHLRALIKLIMTKKTYKYKRTIFNFFYN